MSAASLSASSPRRSFEWIYGWFFSEPPPPRNRTPNPLKQINEVLSWSFSEPESIENQYRVVAMASVQGIRLAVGGDTLYFSVPFVLTIEGQQVVDWTIDEFAKIDQ